MRALCTRWHRALVADPQTSGGLLVSCSAAAAPAVLAQFHAEGFAQAAVVGALSAPTAGPQVRFVA